jgi:hypothetical protein
MRAPNELEKAASPYLTAPPNDLTVPFTRNTFYYRQKGTINLGAAYDKTFWLGRKTLKTQTFQKNAATIRQAKGQK